MLSVFRLFHENNHRGPQCVLDMPETPDSTRLTCVEL